MPVKAVQYRPICAFADRFAATDNHIKTREDLQVGAKPLPGQAFHAISGHCSRQLLSAHGQAEARETQAIRGRHDQQATVAGTQRAIEDPFEFLRL